MIRTAFVTAAAAAAIVVTTMHPALAAETAKPVPTPVPTALEPNGVPQCQITPSRGVDAVTVRRERTNNSDAVGVIYAGQRANADCTNESGAIVSACGATSNDWVPVYWAGGRFFVTFACVDFV